MTRAPRQPLVTWFWPPLKPANNKLQQDQNRKRSEETVAYLSLPGGYQSLPLARESRRILPAVEELRKVGKVCPTRMLKDFICSDYRMYSASNVLRKRG
jgi:hypothetical protein